MSGILYTTHVHYKFHHYIIRIQLLFEQCSIVVGLEIHMVGRRLVKDCVIQVYVTQVSNVVPTMI